MMSGRVRRHRAPLLVAIVGVLATVAAFTSAPHDGTASASVGIAAAPHLPSSFAWTSDGPLVAPQPDTDHRALAIKDPTVVRSGGRWHVFATTTDGSAYNLVYLSFGSWAKAAKAPHHYLDRTPIGAGYRAAPQVFWFEPQKLWYLVYQTGNASYSTNPDIADPDGWSAPRDFYPAMPETVRHNIGKGAWVDMWVTCDDTSCSLFSSDTNGHLYRSDTPLSAFPGGFSEPVIALQGKPRDVVDAGAVYRVRGGSNQYLLLMEALGRNGRYVRSWTSPTLTGTWTPLAATEDAPFAGAANVTSTGTPWTRDISQGELIRDGVDQTMTVNPCRLQYLHEGVDPTAGGPYPRLPWQLGMLDQVDAASCRTASTSPPDSTALSTTFEDGTTQAWRSKSGEALDVVSGVDAGIDEGGSHALSVRDRGGVRTGPTVTIPASRLLAGRSYVVTAYARVAPGQDPAGWAMRVRGGRPTLARSNGSAWAALTTTFTYGGSGAVTLTLKYVKVCAGDAPPTSLYLDSVLVRTGAGTDGKPTPPPCD